MYNDKGVLDFDKYHALTRSYAPAIQGHLISKNYNVEHGIFILKYMCDMSIKAPTEIYLNSKDHFDTGYKYSLETDLKEHKLWKQIDESDPNYFKI